MPFSKEVIMQNAYWVISLGIAMLGFVFGQMQGQRKRGYEDGVLKASLDTLTNKVNELSVKIDDINIGELRQRVKALEKSVFKERE